MAEYHLHVKVWSKGAGKGAGGHARYILRQGPYAERRIEQVDGATVRREKVSRADEVVAIEHGHMPNWAQADPLRYWDAADQYERANGSVYREVEFALPAELTPEQNRLLAREFATLLAHTKDGPTPYTLAVHRSDKNPDLLHCHLMLSDKVNDGIERDPAVWFKRAANKGKDPALGGAPKTQARGYDREKDRQWVDLIRPIWADFANRALERAGIDARIDHRTLEARRQEQERLAQEAADRGDELAAARHRKAAGDLDRPAQPKRGRVLQHGGPRAAPDQARAWDRYQVDLEARQAAVERSRKADAEAAKIRRAVAIHERAMLRQGYRTDAWEIRERWHFRQHQREMDRLAIEEQHDLDEEERAQEAIRKPRHSKDTVPMLSNARLRKKTPWRQWREATLVQRYGEEVAAKAVREDWYIRMRPDLGGLNIVVTDPKGWRHEIVDGGDIVRSEGDGIRDIPLMLDLAQAKGWSTLRIDGSDEFRIAAAKAAIERGMGVEDKELEDRVIAIMEREQPSMPNQAAQIEQDREQVRSRKAGRDSTDDWW